MTHTALAWLEMRAWSQNGHEGCEENDPCSGLLVACYTGNLQNVSGDQSWRPTCFLTCAPCSTHRGLQDPVVMRV